MKIYSETKIIIEMSIEEASEIASEISDGCANDFRRCLMSAVNEAKK